MAKMCGGKMQENAGKCGQCGLHGEKMEETGKSLNLPSPQNFPQAELTEVSSAYGTWKAARDTLCESGGVGA